MTPDIPSSFGRTAAIAVLLTSTSLVCAQTKTNTSPSDQELAKLKQNPVSGLRQVGLDTTLSPDVPVTGGTEGAYSLQVVWPFKLTENWRVITYSIVPVLQLPEEDGGYEVGLGNALFNFYVTASNPTGDFVWGVGPAVLLPTRNNSDLGSDRLGLGPSGVLYYAKEDWGAGLVLQNVWSGGGDSRNEVNAFGAQYILNYNLPQGWYLYSNSTITADWTADSGDEWTVPVGGGFGKVFTVAGESLSASLQGIANVIRPDDSAKWAINFQFSILFP
ncbi:Uncharacterised protein [Halioglobus japonicus]|nr:Uncharacterised protein [Halioglobus japonicus]